MFRFCRICSILVSLKIGDDMERMNLCLKRKLKEENILH